MLHLDPLFSHAYSRMIDPRFRHFPSTIFFLLRLDKKWALGDKNLGRERGLHSVIGMLTGPTKSVTHLSSKPL